MVYILDVPLYVIGGCVAFVVLFVLCCVCWVIWPAERIRQKWVKLRGYEDYTQYYRQVQKNRVELQSDYYL